MTLSVNGNRAKRIIALMLGLLLVLSAMALVPVHAEQDDGAQGDLTQGVYDNIKDVSYAKENGGTLKGTDLIDNKGQLKDGNVQQLSRDGQQDLVNDITKCTNAESKQYSGDKGDAVKTQLTLSDGTTKTITSQYNPETGGGVNNEVASNWFKDLQTHPGVGTKFMNAILGDTTPDFVTAQKIYEPFRGPVGILIGCIAVFGMGAMGISLVSDIFYIALPPVRLLVDSSRSGQNSAGNGNDHKTSYLFSHDAIAAVQQAEDQDSDGSSNKQALLIYLKKRILMLVALGFCLLLLVGGKIYTFVGWILDIFTGLFE